MFCRRWLVGYHFVSKSYPLPQGRSIHVFYNGFYDRFQELAITTNPSFLVGSFVGMGCTMGSSRESECRWWSRQRVVDIHDVGVVHDVGSCGWMLLLEVGDVHDVGSCGWHCESNTS